MKPRNTASVIPPAQVPPARAASPEHPTLRGHKSFPPPAWPNAARRARRILRPYGRSAWPSFTIDTFTTADPARAGWRLHMHAADGTRVMLFERNDLPASPNDPDAEVVAALDWACVRPGDRGDERLDSFTPTQLAWSVRHAAALREEARVRLGWADPTGRLANLRTDIDVVYQVREHLSAAVRHRASAGVVEAHGRTRGACRDALTAALTNHLSALPVLTWGARTGAAYLLFPRGSEWLVQRAMPGQEPEPAVTLEARNAPEAAEVLARTLAKVEGVPILPESWRRRPRPAARASSESGVMQRVEGIAVSKV